MKLVDTDTVLSGYLGVKRNQIVWVSHIESVDARKVGGWMFNGKWVDLRFEDNVQAPALMACCVDNNGENVYHLLSLDKEGKFSEIVWTNSRDWANNFLPYILDFLENRFSEKQIVDISISGEPLKAARWLAGYLHKGATVEDAVDFALKFAKIAWERRQWEDTMKQSEQQTEAEWEKSGILTQTESDTD